MLLAPRRARVDIDAGILDIIVGFASLRPAEVVIITIRQAAGQTER